MAARTRLRRAAAGDDTRQAGCGAKHLPLAAVRRRGPAACRGFHRCPVSAGERRPTGAKEMGAGDADIAMNFAAPLIVALDSGTQIVVLAGVHVGCFELI